MIATIARKLSSAAATAASMPDETLVPFAAGALGNFPYYWEDPRTLAFNALTYGWINSSLRAGEMPVRLDGTFTTLFTQALGSISYMLSESDEAELRSAEVRAFEQQRLLLQAWRTAFGSLPPPSDQPPIDVILNTIATEWAIPPTDLMAMQESADIFALLNRTPTGGPPVVTALARYLDVLGDSVPLLNATTMNTGRIQRALQAVQNPTAANGALETTDGIRPAYAVTTPLADILRGLADETHAIRLPLEVSRPMATHYAVAVDGGESLHVPMHDFFSIETGGTGDWLQDYLPAGSEPAQLDVTFEGLTPVSYGPVAFDHRLERNWYWPQPIVDAIANGSRDVSGFKFSPDPGIDFGPSGPFGFLTKVLISRLPRFELTLHGPAAATLFRSSEEIAPARCGMTFLGVSLPHYTINPAMRASGGSVRLILQSIAGNLLDSRAWVHLVATEFPAAYTFQAPAHDQDR